MNDAMMSLFSAAAAGKDQTKQLADALSEVERLISEQGISYHHTCISYFRDTEALDT